MSEPVGTHWLSACGGGGNYGSLEITIHAKKYQDGKIVFGKTLNSCNVLHDQKHHSQLFVFHDIYFGQN